MNRLMSYEKYKSDLAPLLPAFHPAKASIQSHIFSPLLLSSAHLLLLMRFGS